MVGLGSVALNCSRPEHWRLEASRQLVQAHLVLFWRADVPGRAHGATLVRLSPGIPVLGCDEFLHSGFLARSGEQFEV
jgi:hypothetical protein